jgi:hypothetical protein
MMSVLIGVLLALGVAILGRLVGFERDRSFFPTILVTIASYYVLFAAMDGSVATLGLEVLVFVAFLSVAVIGYRTSLWAVAAALAGHGLFDLFHEQLIFHPGVPTWWPMFCLAFDLGLAAYVGLLLMRRSSMPFTPG